VTGDLLIVDTHRIFAERVEKESGGKLVIKRVDPSQVGGFKQAMEGIMMGNTADVPCPNANLAVHGKGLMIMTCRFYSSMGSHHEICQERCGAGH